MEQILIIEQELELLERLIKEKQDALFCLKCEVEMEEFVLHQTLKNL